MNNYHAFFPHRIDLTFLYSFACSLSKIPTFFRQSSSLSCNGRIIHSRRALQRVFIRDSMALWRNTIRVRQAPISRVAPEIRWNKIQIKLPPLCKETSVIETITFQSYEHYPHRHQFGAVNNLCWSCWNKENTLKCTKRNNEYMVISCLLNYIVFSSWQNKVRQNNTKGKKCSN